MDISNLTSEATALLREMISIPSPSFNEDAVCSHICSWMDDKGIGYERKGNNIAAFSTVDEKMPMLMLCAHIDTVMPSEGYSFDPYRPDGRTASEVISGMTGKTLTEEEVVAGLGSNDDGASVVAMIAAYRFLYGKANLALVLTCEEERSGRNGMTGLWPELSDRIGYAIVGEPTGMKAAISERGLLVIDATAQGISGHAARNEGKNALYIALEDIERLRKHDFAKISPIMGKVNLNVTQINAGTAHNVIPDKCTFVIDIRPTEQYSNIEILEELQHICKSGLKARNLENRSSATLQDSPLTATAESLGIETFSSSTTSDWMRIDCDAIKMGPGESSRSHRKDEYVLASEIEDGIRKYIEFIKHFRI